MYLAPGGHWGVASSAIGAVAMRQISVDHAEQHDGLAALSLMEEALRLLDRCGGALEAGADLDSAICRLRDYLGPLAASSREAAPATAGMRADDAHIAQFRMADSSGRNDPPNR